MKINCCIGNFDGVHKGHQALINKCLELSGEDYASAVITFEPNFSGFFKDRSSKVITDVETKKELLYSYGIEQVIIIPFDDNLAKMDYNDFIRCYLSQLDINYLVYGSDFTFGYKAKGNSTNLPMNRFVNFNLSEVKPIFYGNDKISSSRIISLIEGGQLELANEMLGHNYTFHNDSNVVPLSGNYKVMIDGEEQFISYKGETDQVITFISEL